MAISNSSTMVYSIFCPQYWKFLTCQAWGLKCSWQGQGFLHLKHFPSVHALLMSMGTPPWAQKVPSWFGWTSALGIGEEDIVVVISIFFPNQFLLKVIWPLQHLWSAISARIASAWVRAVSHFAKLSVSQRFRLLLLMYSCYDFSFLFLHRLSTPRSCTGLTSNHPLRMPYA